MVRTSQQDAAAFSLLIQRHQTPVMNFFRRSGDSMAAEDLAQETFLRLYNYRSRYQPTAKFTTFLYTLARRTWIDHLRKTGRRRKATDVHAADAVGRAESAQSTAARIQAREALAELSEEMRIVVILNVYQGMKYQEIADVLEIPLGTVKTRMYHATRKLRSILRDG